MSDLVGSPDILLVWTCLYASDQQERWARICEAVGHRFEPDRWPTLEEYVAGSSASPNASQ